MLFKPNDQQWFNVDSIESVDDYGYDMGVKLKSGREYRIHGSQRDRLLAAINPAPILVPADSILPEGDYKPGEIVPMDTAQWKKGERPPTVWFDADGFPHCN